MELRARFRRRDYEDHMFHVQYYLSNGEEISYMCAGDWPTIEDTNAIALLVAQHRPDVLPDSVFVNVRLYASWMANFNSSLSMGAGAIITPSEIVKVWTAVGPLTVVIKPWACDAKMFLIGNNDDFERYDIDKIFEEVVLRDCDRE